MFSIGISCTCLCSCTLVTQVSMRTKGYINCFSMPTCFSWNYHHHCINNPLVVWMLLMRLDSFRQKSRSLGMSGSSNTLICSFGGYFLYGTDGTAQVWCPQRGLSHYKYQSVPAWGLQGNPNFSSEIKMRKQRTKSHTERKINHWGSTYTSWVSYLCNSFFCLALKHICSMSSDLTWYTSSDLRPHADFGT